MKRCRLRIKGISTATELKAEIQDLIRTIAISRDGGCVLRHYSEAGPCGGLRNDGKLILQAEHLVTRSNSASFGDMRNIVTLCRNHHLFYKPQHSREYWDIIRKHIGEERWDWIKRVEQDHSPHKVDWKLVRIVLEQQIRKNNIKTV